MIAWVIASTATICGDTQFCVKLGSPIFHLLTALVIYGIGYRLFNKKTGFWSAIAYSTLPGVTVSSYLISTDAPLLFFWALALYAFIRALKDWHIKWWILMGVAAGLGMLSKYTMILFFVSAGLYLLTSRENRIYLISFKFWLAVLIAGLIYFPNFLWNMDHDFVSFMHTQDNADLKGIQFHWGKMFEFIGAQFGVFGPIFFSILMINILVLLPIICRKDSYKILFSFVIPFFSLIVVISLLSRAHANWAVPIYIAGTVIVVAILSNFASGFWIKVSVLLHIAIGVIFYQFHNISEWLDINSKADFFKRIKNQRALAEAVKKELSLHNDVILLTTDRKTHATLLYYLRYENGDPPYIVKWNGNKQIDDHYDMTTDMNPHIGDNFLMVTKPHWAGGVIDNFAFGQKSGYVTLAVYPDRAIEYDFYYLKDFKGYKK
jgi:Ca2+/Na+ antiporter